MPWSGPRYDGDFPTLGWTLLDWWSSYLPSPRDTEAPLTFTDEQAMVLVRWYSIHPITGQYVYRRGQSRRAKGWGKSPWAAAIAIAALAGPVRFDGWNADGEPAGRPWGTKRDPNPWVQVAAVSEDQTENTYSVIYEFLTANDGQAADDLRIDPGLTRCFLMDRPGRIEPVTASAGAREGQPITDVIMDETHLWLPANHGRRLARTLRRNVGKMNGRSLETTNAFVPGENSVAEATWKSIETSGGIFADAVEPPEIREDAPDAELRAAMAIAYGDSSKDRGGWVDLDRLVADARDDDAPWEDVRRFNLNQPCDDRAKAISKKLWDDLAKPGIEVPRGTRIGLGFDGSISDDATALRACAIIDGKPYTWLIGVWLRPKKAPKGWRIPRGEVAERVAWAMDYYDVGRMLCDPAKWQTEIEQWSLDYGDEIVLFFDTNQATRMSRACDRWDTALAEAAYSHDGDAVTTEHVLNMHRKKVNVRHEDDDGRTKFVFTKGPDRSKKIDAGIADVLALEACMTMPANSGPIPFAAYG
jgi:hypothetical protein